MKKPAWTEKVERGMWLIVARSPSVFSAEEGGVGMTAEERDSIAAAARYADHHWAKHGPYWRDHFNADVPTIGEHARKPEGARRQKAWEAEGRGTPDTEHTGGQVAGLAESPGGQDVEGA